MVECEAWGRSQPLDRRTRHGTRLAVDFLLGLFAAGWTEAQVLENYPHLTSESLRAVFAFAAETLGEEGFYPLHHGAV